MKKIFYFDVETTGLDAQRNALIQLAYIIEIDGEEKESGNLLIQPFAMDIITESALAINKRTKEEIFMPPFVGPGESFQSLLSVLDKYVDRYNREDKFYPAGYNVQFDCNFLSQFFAKNQNNFYGSYFHYLKLDPSSALLVLDQAGIVNLPNYKLATVCEHMGIPIEAHDALSDIKATRTIVHKLQKGVVK